MQLKSAGRKFVDVKIRRCRNILRISGVAIIIIGIWDCIKSFLFYYLQPGELEQYAHAVEIESLSPRELEIIFILVQVIGGLIEILMNVVIGIAAIKQSRGKGKAWLCIAVSLIDFSITGYSILETIIWPDQNQSIEMVLVFMFLSITTMIALAVVVVNSVKLLIYEKKKKNALISTGE